MNFLRTQLRKIVEQQKLVIYKSESESHISNILFMATTALRLFVCRFIIKIFLMTINSQEDLLFKALIRKKQDKYSIKI